MPLKEEKCIATPGFMGFVPSYKFQFGLTYGNATRHILDTDPSLKQGKVQQEIRSKQIAKARRNLQELDPSLMSGDVGGGRFDKSSSLGDSENNVWKRGNKYATGDDRFSFPPVPGYTGYIPRSQEHFGRPYVETTKASLSDFERMLKFKNELPPRIKAIKAQQKSGIPAPSTSSNAKVKNSTPKPTFAYSAKSSTSDERSPYALPPNHPQKSFISGYTGFVPRLQNHFGEPYTCSVRKAIDEFTAPSHPQDTKNMSATKQSENANVQVGTHPIPGFTGFIPGAKYGYATTFGKTTEIAYNNFNHRDTKGRLPQPERSEPVKDLHRNQPIPGFKGHIPQFIFSSERSYGISTKDCLDRFAAEREAARIAV
ncbi:hypothetical protein HK098_006444 [Nowakowskiella sp. JEL0407]|nr:hypothetical protein HK098_006444 [Nowakowskiella sp. JEL0407]